MTDFKNIIDTIKAYDTIIVHRHVSPDPDALGSQMGLAQVIRDNFGKTVYCVGEETEGLHWMGRMDHIEDDVYADALVIAIDTANSPRVSDQRYNTGKFLIKIDHHPVVEQYGDMNYVDTSASSASEIVCQLAFENDLILSVEAAKALYAGIVGDTGRFLFNNTTQRTMEIVARLKGLDFSTTKINERLNTRTLKEARLMGYVLQHIEEEAGVASVYLDQAMLDQFQVNERQTACTVGQPGTVEGVESWVIFVDAPDGSIRVHLRSKGPIINTIAMQFGGGGHPLASGATIHSKEEMDQIVALLKDNVKAFHQA